MSFCVIENYLQAGFFFQVNLDIVQNSGSELEVRARGGTRGNSLTMSIMSSQLWQLGDKLPVLEQYR